MDEEQKFREMVEDLISGPNAVSEIAKLAEKISRESYREGWNDCNSSSFGDSSWDPPVAWLRAIDSLLKGENK